MGFQSRCGAADDSCTTHRSGKIVGPVKDDMRQFGSGLGQLLSRERVANLSKAGPCKHPYSHSCITPLTKPARRVLVASSFMELLRVVVK